MPQCPKLKKHGTFGFRVSSAKDPGSEFRRLDRLHKLAVQVKALHPPILSVSNTDLRTRGLDHVHPDDAHLVLILSEGKPVRDVEVVRGGLEGEGTGTTTPFGHLF